MAQIKFNIEVLTVSQPTAVKTASGGYNQIEVAFKKDGKVDGKKLIDFKFQDVYKFFRTCKGGENVQVVSEKKEGEKYWNWISAEVSAVGSSSNSAESNSGANQNAQSVSMGESGNTSGGQSVAGSRGRVTGSNYETPEERALRREADRVRQYYIVRQSSVSAAVELLKAQGNNFDTGNVIEKAREFEAYVFEAVPEAGGEVKKKRGRPAKEANPVAEIESDIPF
jgi:hypothetical protein